MNENWAFVHHRAARARWVEGLRTIFEYRDLGIAAATDGDYVAHVIRAKGRPQPDAVQTWHVHDCRFQMILVLNGWATFEYEGQGRHTLHKGDCVHQVPGIAHREIECSEDFEVLEIVAPADFRTREVDPPVAGVP